VHLGEFVIEARVWLNDCDLWGISNMQLTNSHEYTNEWSREGENLQWNNKNTLTTKEV